MTFSYANKGFYARQIERWMRPYLRDQCLLLRAENLFASPQSSMDRVTDFLGPARFAVPNLTSVQQSGYATPLEPALRDRLANVFRQPNRDLAQLVGIHWPGR
jgi:hypothetical protein